MTKPLKMFRMIFQTQKSHNDNTGYAKKRTKIFLKEPKRNSIKKNQEKENLKEWQIRIADMEDRIQSVSLLGILEGNDRRRGEHLFEKTVADIFQNWWATWIPSRV